MATELTRRGAWTIGWIVAVLIGTLMGYDGPRAAAGASSASKTKLAVVPGGPHPYFAPMPSAVLAAKRAFNLTAATYRVPPTFTLNDENQTIESLAAQGYNAFAIFPDDANGTNSTIAELAGRGIPSVDIGACTNRPSQAKFCLATDVYKAAYQGARDVIQAIGGHGRIVHLTGLLLDPNTKLREQGVAKAVAETRGAVKLVQTVADIDAPGPADNAVHSLLAAHGNNIDGIVTTAYNPAVAAAKGLSESKNSHIKLIAIDADPIVLKAIQNGYAAGTIEQNPYGQAYIAAYALNLMVNNGCKMKATAPFKIDSGTVFVTKANVGHFLKDVQAYTTGLLRRFKEQYMTC
jgi:ribose transport system substrate-binding protein